MASDSEKKEEKSGRKEGFHDFSYIQKEHSVRLEYAKQYHDLVKAYTEDEHFQKIALAAKANKDDIAAQKAYAEAVSAIEKAAAERAGKVWDNTYKHATATKKAAMMKAAEAARKKDLEVIEETYARDMVLAEGNAAAQAALTAQFTADRMAANDRIADAAAKKDELQRSKQFKDIDRLKKNMSDVKAAGGGIVDIGLQLSKDIGKLDMKAFAAEAEERVKASQEEMDRIEEAFNNTDDPEEQRKLQEQYDEAKRRKDAAAMQAAVGKAMSGLQDAYKKAFNEAEDMLSTYKGHIDARLQGSDKTYNDIMGKISSNLSTSPFVRTQKMIENMRAAVDQGIAYNVEQRAFLQTVSDKIANTFDAFDSNLTRLIRLQQADTTAARMGMEAALTKFFNNMFQDSSYLNNLSDQVAAAIIDANSQLDRNSSAEFEYTVQKWLGSLSSVGASDSMISNIATGINYLATGDVTNLSSNTQLQTLFAMSAARAGLEYSELLLNGMNASSTNRLLESMVTYLKEIAENSDSQVVRSAYGDIFNMSLSDMKAISNLNAGDISNIAGNSLSYSGMQSELNYQMSQLITRTSISDMLSNMYNNAIFGVAEDMASNPATYAMTKMLDFMNTNEIDMAIPFINAMGFGVDLNTSVQDIMRLGVGLSQAFSFMGNILSGLGSGGGLNLSAWGGTEYTQRGSGLTFSTGSTFGGTSGSTYVATSSSDDMKNSSLNSATDDSEETSKITNKNNNTEHTFDDFYNATIGEAAKSYVNVQDLLFAQVYNSEQNYLGARDTRMKFLADGELVTSDTLALEWLSNVFGDSSLVSRDGVLAVRDVGNPFSIQGESLTAMPVHIASIAEALKSSSNTVKLDKDSTVKIDSASFAKAFKEAMGHNEKDKVMTMNDLINGIKDGSIIVRIANEPGRRIQVDTEWAGSIGYASEINW